MKPCTHDSYGTDPQNCLQCLRDEVDRLTSKAEEIAAKAYLWSPDPTAVSFGPLMDIGMTFAYKDMVTLIYKDLLCKEIPQSLLDGRERLNAELETKAKAMWEPTEFNVILKSPGSNVLATVRAIRALTNMSLPDALTMVRDSQTTPQIVREGVNKDDVAQFETKLKEAGAVVELKGTNA